MQIYTDMNELHQHWLQVAEGGSGLHTETQLLLKVTAKRNLNNMTEKHNKVLNKEKIFLHLVNGCHIITTSRNCWRVEQKKNH